MLLEIKFLLVIHIKFLRHQYCRTCFVYLWFIKISCSILSESIIFMWSGAWVYVHVYVVKIYFYECINKLFVSWSFAVLIYCIPCTNVLLYYRLVVITLWDANTSPFSHVGGCAMWGERVWSKITTKSHFLFSSRFMLFLTFKKNFFGRGSCGVFLQIFWFGFTIVSAYMSQEPIWCLLIGFELQQHYLPNIIKARPHNWISCGYAVIVREIPGFFGWSVTMQKT